MNPCQQFNYHINAAIVELEKAKNLSWQPGWLRYIISELEDGLHTEEEIKEAGL